MAKTKPFPKPSTIETGDDVGDLTRDDKSWVVISAGGRDRGPTIKSGPRGGRRLVHQSVERTEIQYEHHKVQAVVTRVVDAIGAMHTKGTISDALYGCARRFQSDFDNSHWESTPAMRFDGLPPSGKASSDAHRPPQVIDARTAVFAAMKAMGGHSSPCGIALWWIVGMRWSLRQLAQREAITRAEVWTGTLIGALGLLDSHYAEIGQRRR